VYSKETIQSELDEWKDYLTDLTRMTGKTNFSLLKEHLLFKEFFPSVTKSDEMIINRILSDIGKYRR